MSTNAVLPILALLCLSSATAYRKVLNKIVDENCDPNVDGDCSFIPGPGHEHDIHFQEKWHERPTAAIFLHVNCEQCDLYCCHQNQFICQAYDWNEKTRKCRLYKTVPEKHSEDKHTTRVACEAEHHHDEAPDSKAVVTPRRM